MDHRRIGKAARLFRGSSRFWRDRRGVTAIEFGILALPFLMLLFAIFEVCIAFAAQQLLTNATDEIARSVRTGQIRQELDEAQLRQLVCDRIDLLVAAGCPDLEVDLRSFPTFAQAAAVRVRFTASGDIDTSDFDVAPGPASSNNMLRVFYRWPVMMNFLRQSMSNLPGGKTLLFATTTWRNEPFNE